MQSIQPYSRTKTLWYISIILLLFSISASAQTIALVWDSENGCENYTESGGRKFLEEIDDAPCVRTGDGSQVHYFLVGDVGTIAATSWSVAGGTLSGTPALLSCDVTWLGVGYGSIQVTISYTDNTVKTYQMCIEKNDGPKAAFTIFNAYGTSYMASCELENIYFSNLSIAADNVTIVSQHWDFGDGSYSSEWNPVHAYAASGNYTVILTVTNACNISSTVSHKVEVGKEGIEIACPSVVCEGVIANYRALLPQAAARCQETAWAVLGGEIVNNDIGSINVIWNDIDNHEIPDADDGFGFLSFNSTSCDVPCPTITTIKVPVIQTIGHIKGATEVCGKEQYIYSLPKWPATDFQWELVGDTNGASLIFNDQRNEVILNAPETGQVVLKCTYYNTLIHCGGHATLVIKVKAKTRIVGPKKVCLNASGTYELQSSDQTPIFASWILDTPTGPVNDFNSSFSYTFNDPGTYVLTASASGYCEHPPYVITIAPAPAQPSSILGPVKVCPVMANQYSVANTDSNIEISWEVQGGTIIGPDAGNTVSIAFNTTGPHQVLAYANNKTEPYCRSIARTLLIELLDPVLNITSSQPFNPICASSYANYTVNENSTPYIHGETYSWVIDPPSAGSIVTGQDTNTVNVLWNIPTLATANLKVIITQCGLTFEKDVEVTVITEPTITINAPTTVCAGALETFSLNGYTMGAITWDFGDGVISHDLSPIHSFPQTNIVNAAYNVSVSIQHANGCITTVSQNTVVDVIPVPPAQMTLSGTVMMCDVGDIIPLNVNIQGGFGNTTKIEWFKTTAPTTILQTENLTTGITGVFEPWEFGSYFAIVTYTNGCTTQTNTVHLVQYCGPPVTCEILGGPPTISMSTEVNGCLSVSATGITTGPTPLSQTWESFGGLLIDTTSGGTATFIAPHPGTFIIRYKAVFQSTIPGEVCTLAVQSDVIVPYVAELLYDISCGTTAGTYNVILRDHSTLHPGTMVSHWFYQGSSTTALNTTDVSSIEIPNLTPGSTYTFSLKINDNVNPDCISTVTITMPNLPSAAFTFSSIPVCPGEPIAFQATDLTEGNTYLWNFSDGALNSLPNPQREYKSGGSYSVMLTITDKYNCQTVNTQTISVYPSSMDGIVLPAFGTGCIGSSVLLSLQSTGIQTPSTYQWMNGENEVIGATNNTYNATSSGNYWLTVTNANGCSKQIANAAIVNMIPPLNISIEAPNSVCENDIFTISGFTSSSGVTYSWLVDNVAQPQWDGLSSFETSMAAGTYVISLNIQQSSNGGTCNSTASKTITILPLPEEPQISYTIDCTAYRVALSVQNPQPGTYVWSNGASGLSTTLLNGGVVQVRHINGNGCSVTAEVNVPKNPQDYMWIVPQGCYEFCKESFVDLHTLIGPAVAADVKDWEWLENGNTDASGTFYVADYPITTLATFQLTIDNGACKVTSPPVSVSEYECKDCNVKIGLKDGVKLKKDQYGVCYYSFVFAIENPNGFALYATITANNGEGVLNPTTVIIPPTAPGVFEQFPMSFYPTSTFNGGSVTFTFTLNDKQFKNRCSDIISIDLPDFNCKDAVYNPDDRPIHKSLNDTSLIQLKVVPNPANGKTEIHYLLESDQNSSAYIEVFDLLGRSIDKLNVNDTVGIINLSLSNYPVGFYMVVLKTDNGIFKQQNLIVK